MQQNGGVLKKKIKILLKNMMDFGVAKLYFYPIIKHESHCMEKQIRNKLKKDASRSDDILSSYSCSKFKKCSFVKNAFKDKSTDFIVINF